ncbi:MAG: hypothetical protein ACR2PL_17630, partial [Dehalococcoidia bacterium]
MPARRRILQGLLAAVASTFFATFIIATLISQRDNGSAQAQSAVRGSLNQISGQTTGLTLQETWDLFSKTGQAWHQGARILALSSVDALGDGANAGADGRRVSWTALVGSSDGKSALHLHSVGAVVDQRDEVPGQPGLQALSKPDIDSPAALATARAVQPTLSPTTDKSHGYQYSLSGANPSAIAIVGSVNDKAASIDVDAHSGSVVAREAYGPAATGGIVYSSDAGQTWTASNLTGQMVTSVASDMKQPLVAWASVAGQSQISVYGSTDGGQTWSKGGDLPNQAGSWPYVIAVGSVNGSRILALGAASGIWLSTDDAKTWTHAAGLPDGPAQWATFVKTSSGFELHASVVTGADAGHYSSQDLHTWNKLGPPGRLSQLDNQTGVAVVTEPATPNSAPAPAEVRHAAASAALPLPARALRLAGDSTQGHTLLAEAPDALYRSNDSGGTWQLVLQGHFGSLGASPSFTSTGIAVAGGFRAGLYRTADSGQ